ncbi:MAG: hypothetical protein K2X60_06540 [Xanthobacteraceae bacterium]|nr:hypothetical protein [Xanthobacteraceae bacterium]
MDHANEAAFMLEPLVLSGPAIERDNLVKDRNHSPKPDEAVWCVSLHEQDAEISACEVGFFETLRSRIAKDV